MPSAPHHAVMVVPLSAWHWVCSTIERSTYSPAWRMNCSGSPSVRPVRGLREGSTHSSAKSSPSASQRARATSYHGNSAGPAASAASPLPAPASVGEGAGKT